MTNIKATETHTITYKNKDLSLKFDVTTSKSGATQLIITAQNGMATEVTGIDYNYRFEAGRRHITFASKELDNLIISLIRKYRYA